MNDPIPGRCNAKRAGVDALCKNGAGQKTDHVGLGHCWKHGGTQETDTSPKIVSDRKDRLLRDMAKFSIPVENADPGPLLLEEVARTAGHVGWLHEQIVDVLTPEQMVSGVKQVTRRTGMAMAPSGQLVPVDETTTVVGPGVAVLWSLYQSERKHLAAVCRAALDAGIAERQVRIAEQQGVLAARLVTAVLGDLNLTEEQRALVPGVVRARLALVRTA